MKKALVRLISLVFCIFLPPSARAAVSKLPHQGLLSSVNLGIRYSSILENRGVIFYRDFQIDPVLGLFFFDDRLEFLGDSLGFRDFVWKDTLRLRTRFVSISDNPLFPSHDSIRLGSPHRPSTYQWENSAEIFLPGYNDHYLGELDVSYAKDIDATHGSYFNLQSKIRIVEFRLPLGGIKIEPNLYSSIGLGDSANNQYFYGKSATGGFSDLSYGLWFAFPEESDRYYPIVQIRHFQVLGNNRNADFAAGRGEGWLFSFIATIGIL